MSRLLLALVVALPLLSALAPAQGGLPPVIYDVPYGDYHPSLLFDWYPPANSTGNDPVLIFLHGGVPPIGSKLSVATHYPDMLYLLRLNGIGVVAVEFTPYPEFKYPAQLHDVQLAIQFLRFYSPLMGIDSERIGVWGFSSGALLAGWLSFSENGANPTGTPIQKQSTRPLIFLNYGAITDFSLLVPWFTGNFFGETFLGEVDPDLIQDASLTWELCNIQREYTPPVYSLYGLLYSEPPLTDPHDGYFGHALQVAMRSCAPEPNDLSVHDVRDEPLDVLNRKQLTWVMTRFGMPGPLAQPQKK